MKNPCFIPAIVFFLFAAAPGLAADTVPTDIQLPGTQPLEAGNELITMCADVG